jgi:hypothetical protein
MSRFEIKKTEILYPKVPPSIADFVIDKMKSFLYIIALFLLVILLLIVAVLYSFYFVFYKFPLEMYKIYKADKAGIEPTNEVIKMEEENEYKGRDIDILHESHTFTVKVEKSEHDTLVYTQPPIVGVNGEFIEHDYYVFNNIIILNIPQGDEYMYPIKLIALDCVTQEVNVLTEDHYFSAIQFDRIDEQNLYITCENGYKKLEFHLTTKT